MVDRYTILQRKLDDLRILHEDGKKLHQTESARLKSDLARCQKTIADQSSQIDKQKKHADALQSRIQDLKNSALTDKSEIAALKEKLKVADAQKHQSVSELEKSLAEQLSKSQSLESNLHVLNNHLQAARSGAQQAESQLASVQQQLSDTRQSFAQQRLKSLLSHASTTIPSTTYRELKHIHHSNEIKILRLERKLANAEDQVNQLAHLVRQVNDRNDLLNSQLADANDQISIYETMLNDTQPEINNDLDWEPEWIKHNSAEDDHLTASMAHLSEILVTCYNLRSQLLLFAYTCLDKTLFQTSFLAKQQSEDLTNVRVSHKAIETNLETVQQQRSVLSNQLSQLQATHATLKRTCTSFQEQVTTLQQQQQQLVFEHEMEMKKDKDTLQRLTSIIQKNRMAEDALRTEIDRLLASLAEAERYQEAYFALSSQVDDLLARSQLAEEEAERLGKFNAEILGNSNPAQRVAYVDRIRHELAEAKHKIIILTREQETIIELNTDLQHELDMYKSVGTTNTDNKPIRTRVQRHPQPY